MGLPHNKSLMGSAVFLRHNMTPAERKLWFGFLRKYSLAFKKQKIVGPYIVDFFCNKVRLSIELDGSQHYEEKAIRRDQIRTSYLEMLEIQELRFPNSDVWDNFEGVCQRIHDVAQKRRNDVVDLSISSLRKKR